MAGRNVEETGMCSKNYRCNMIDCVVDMSIHIQLTFSRSPCDAPVSVCFLREFTNGTVIAEKETTKHFFVEVERGSTVELSLKQIEYGVIFAVDLLTDIFVR